MSANISTMMYVKETPWHGLGHRYETAPETPQEIITAAELDWRVNTAKMKTDLHNDVFNYHAIYREDNNMVLGVVNRARPEVVQNIDAFNAFEQILGREVVVDTAASLGHGETVFGCFKINEGYTVLDDKIDHYFVVMNDHLKADGKVTILNTPIRVVCQNTLSAALSNNSYKVRIPVSDNKAVNSELARKIISGAGLAMDSLTSNAQKMVKQKISRDHIEAVLDELFPMIKAEGDSLHTKANETVEMMRETFLSECLGADNLGNYRGTQYQVFNALTDFSQHYFKNPEKSYDLRYRMNLMPGMGTDSPANLVSKYLKIKDKIAA